MTYSNHETTEFALYFENTEHTWRAVQTYLDEAYEEDRNKESMTTAMEHMLNTTVKVWMDACRVCLLTHLRNNHAAQITWNLVNVSYDAIDTKEIAQAWVENYLTERNME